MEPSTKQIDVPSVSLTATEGYQLRGTQSQDMLNNVYTMFYRQNSNHLVSKNFRYPGGLKEARERAEKHCNVIGAKLNFVQPLISDLQREEDFHLGKIVSKDTITIETGASSK